MRGLLLDPRGGRVPFREYTEAWIANRVKPNGERLAETTTQFYGDILGAHLAQFHSTPIAKISTSAVRAWYAKVAKERSPIQAAKAYRLLRAVLATAETDELIARNPCQLRGYGQERSPERPLLKRRLTRRPNPRP